ncbi:MAG: hypothetical protein IJO40_08400 [Thermoguttaceae bacterium]|nr:hypothetical protein [Thermoguttaceae bacterium]
MKTSAERRLRRALRGTFFVGAVAIGALSVPIESKAADFGISLNFGRGSFFYATDPGPVSVAPPPPRYYYPPPPPPRYYAPPPRYYFPPPRPRFAPPPPPRPHIGPPHGGPRPGGPRPGGPRPGGPRF